MRKLFTKIAAVAMSVLMTTTLPPVVRAADSASITMRIGSVASDTNSLGQSLYYFADKVSEYSNGDIAVEVYNNSALGDNTAQLQQLQVGSLEMCCPTAGALCVFTDSCNVFSLPYLFKNFEAAQEVLSGDAGTMIEEALESVNLRAVGWQYGGYREITANKEIHTPEDMKGLKIRTQDIEMHLAHFKALGSSPIPMAFSEVYTALEQGTIDAEENPISNIKGNNFQEVQDYLIMSNHILELVPMMISESFWQSLTEEQQGFIEQAAKDTIAYNYEFMANDDDSILNEWRNDGTITVIDLTDEERAAFRDAAQEVYDQYSERIGSDLITSIEEVNSKY